METILLTLQKVEKKKLKEIALSERRSVNNLINIAIEKYVNEYMRGN